MSTFKEMSISPDMLRAIDEMGFTDTTNVQAETIPIIREGRDILAQSQTGTGKTIAFTIPAIECIDTDVKAIQVIILSPTRELAQQCCDEVRKLTKYMPYIKTAIIYGGESYTTQFKELKKANIVIGTPGRIMDHMSRGTLKLDNLKMIILDEADEMLNMGFKEDIETILRDAPPEHQTLLFSATVPKGIKEITHEFQNDAVKINLAKDNATLDEIKQVYVDMPKHQKSNVLKLLMFYYRPRRSIVFANTKSMVDELTDLLCDAGLSASGLHGDMKQRQRTVVMTDFKRGKTEILVATDVAARGIDVSDVDYVFNYDIPKMSEYYVHRIGRTGRAGRSGTAITLCCGNQQVSSVKMLARKLRSELSEVSIPTVDDIRKRQTEDNTVKVAKILAKDYSADSQNKVLVETLMSYGYAPEHIATVLADLAFRRNEKGIAKLSDIKVQKKEKKRNEKSRTRDNSEFTNIIINIGSASRCSANHIVGAITERTGMSSSNIGKIIIEPDCSVVALPTEMVDDILYQLRGLKICSKPISASKMSENRENKRSKKSQSQQKYKGQRRAKRANGSDKNFSRSSSKRKKKK